MSKRKDFSDSAVMAILRGGDDAPERTPTETPDNTPKRTPQKAQTGVFTGNPESTATPKHTPEYTPNETPKRTPTDTPDETPKGAPGKPRMSFTFPSVELRERIKLQAGRNGKSVNQYLIELALIDMGRKGR